MVASMAAVVEEPRDRRNPAEAARRAATNRREPDGGVRSLCRRASRPWLSSSAPRTPRSHVAAFEKRAMYSKASAGARDEETAIL